MVDLASVTDGIGEAVKKATDVAQPFLMGAGFVWGATEDLAQAGNYQGANVGVNFAARTQDAIARATGIQLNLAGIGKSPYTFKLNTTGWLNKGLAAAVGAWVYKQAKLPYAREIYDVVYPFGVGYAIGGVFDDPPVQRKAGFFGTPTSPQRIYVAAQQTAVNPYIEA